MGLKACIFDLDGVIVDTAKYHYKAWRQIATDLGFDFSLEDNERLKGVSRMRSLEILLEVGGLTLPQEQKEALAERKNSIYVSYISEITPDELLPGAKDFLATLKSYGIYTALGSASKNAPAILERLKITYLFDVIIDGNKVSKAKPDPEVFLMGARELKVNPAECVVFEDAEAGIDAAILGGMKCIGIGSYNNLWKANVVVSGLNKITYEEVRKLMD
jgi:beta-phosphoglucomutase